MQSNFTSFRADNWTGLFCVILYRRGHEFQEQLQSRVSSGSAINWNFPTANASKSQKEASAPREAMTSLNGNWFSTRNTGSDWPQTLSRDQKPSAMRSCVRPAREVQYDIVRLYRNYARTRSGLWQRRIRRLQRLMLTLVWTYYLKIRINTVQPRRYAFFTRIRQFSQWYMPTLNLERQLSLIPRPTTVHLEILENRRCRLQHLSLRSYYHSTIALPRRIHQ